MEEKRNYYCTVSGVYYYWTLLLSTVIVIIAMGLVIFVPSSPICGVYPIASPLCPIAPGKVTSALV
jgi:hypothetical protein